MLKHSTALKKDKIDSIAIGTFDGLHLGHKQLINNLTPNGALFVIDKGRANLTPGDKRNDYSPYPCFYYKFEQIKDLDCLDFVTLLKKEFPKLKKIVVGYDFKFGAKRACDIFDLKKLFSGDMVVVEEYFIDGISVHSSKVRELVREGKIKNANALIGRQYAISGTVIKGQGLGKKELVPTINLKIESYILPKNGVYATKALVNGVKHPSVTFIGIRESTDANFSCETYLIDKKIGNIESADIFFVDFLRGNRKFNSLEELKSQILTDVEKAKTILI